MTADTPESRRAHRERLEREAEQSRKLSFKLGDKLAGVLQPPDGVLQETNGSDDASALPFPGPRVVLQTPQHPPIDPASEGLVRWKSKPAPRNLPSESKQGGSAVISESKIPHSAPIAVLDTSVLLAPRPFDGRRLYHSFLKGKSTLTLKAYEADLRDFAYFLGIKEPWDAASALFSGTHGTANELALDYKDHMMQRKLASATINRRLSTLRAMSLAANTTGQLDWQLNVQSMRHEQYRDTRGPPVPVVNRIRAELDADKTPRGKRNAAMVRLMFDRGLRQGEVRSLDLSHVDLVEGTIAVMGKGKADREKLRLAPQTLDALKRWIAARPQGRGPLFVALNHNDYGHRLSSEMLQAFCKKLSERFGVRIRPHGFRHAAITNALDKSDGDVRKVQRFSRHANPATLMKYDDSRAEMGLEISKLVAESEDE